MFCLCQTCEITVIAHTRHASTGNSQIHAAAHKLTASSVGRHSRLCVISADQDNGTADRPILVDEKTIR